MDVLTFGLMLICLSYKHRGSVTSWGRTAKRNKILGGVENSYHLVFMGGDIILDDMIQNTEFEIDASKVGLIAIYEGDHYHLQPK